MTGGTAVVALTGLWPGASADVARILAAGPSPVRLVTYASPEPGTLIRAEGAARRPIGPPHAEALVRDLATAVTPTVAVLPEWCEPDRLRPAAPPVHAVTVVDAEHLLAGLATDDPLRAVGLAEHDADDRTVGDLVARQIEQADTVVVTGAPAGGDDWEAGQLRALLHRLAPWAPRITPGELALPVLARSPRRHPAPVPLRGLSGLPAGVHDPIAEYGVTSHVFTARRPFHPGRLHAAAGRITRRVLRSRGHFWLANRPDDVLVWESAGRHTTGPATRWLAALPDEHWDATDPERRVAASFDWDPYYGDRHSRLVFIGIDLDTDDLQRTLTGCLLTDRELADGQDAWRDRPDPFGHRRTVTVQDGT